MIIFCDGAAKGNPGPASIGVSLCVDGKEIGSISETIGVATNNVAEYSALEAALEWAKKNSYKNLLVHADSELMIKQLNGQYKVKNLELKKIFDRIQALKKSFTSLIFKHVPREQNKRADKLANLAF